MMKKCLIMSIVPFFLSSICFSQGNGRDKVLDGNRLFGEGKFDEAANAYQNAKLDNPLSPVIDYNIANTLYEKKQYEEALKQFDEVIRKSDDPLLQAKALFNKGNTLFRLNKLPESVLAFKDALKLVPDDDDAKYNIEYVRARLKQNSEKKQDDQKQEKKQEPSEAAKKLKARAESLVAIREYKKAHDLMMMGLKTDKTIGAFQSFIDRIKTIVDIDQKE